MGYGHLKHTLTMHGVITASGSLCTRCLVKLHRMPELLHAVVTATCFLKYDASIKERLHCIVQGIAGQPTCEGCGAVVKMRISGRERFTFPKYCCSKCSAGASETKLKRGETNTTRYGVDNPMKR